MKLTTKGEYALRAILDLMNRQDENAVRLEDISDRQNISLSYLEQLFRKLRKAGIVSAVRGPGGGYSLSKDPKKITVLDILLGVGDKPILKTKATECSTEECKKVQGIINASNNVIMKVLNVKLEDL